MGCANPDRRTAPAVFARCGRSACPDRAGNRVELASVDAGQDLPGRVLPEATVNGSGPASV